MRYDTGLYEKPKGPYQTIHENGKTYYELSKQEKAPAMLPETKAVLEKNGTLRLEKVYQQKERMEKPKEQPALQERPMEQQGEKKAVKKVAETAEKAVKATAKAADKAVKKTAAKKTAAKKSTAKKAELKTEMFLQFAGKEYTEKEILQKVKEIWTKNLKRKVGEMKDGKIYLKPEESAAYYVVNGDTTGKIDL